MAQIIKDLKLDFGATGNGIGDDAPKLQDFGDWARANQDDDQIVLMLGNGSEHLIDSGDFDENTWFDGIKDLIVVGRSASLISDGGHFFLGTLGAIHADENHSARISTVSAGQSSVSLISSGLGSLFTAGDWAMVSGFDLQGLGQPPNPHFFEFIEIASVAGGTIGFTRMLLNTYKSTWPLFSDGGGGEPDLGGPGTIYALRQSWNVRQLYRDFTVVQEGAQTLARGRDITLFNLTCDDALGGLIPSQNLTWRLINSSQPDASMEVDKMVERATIQGCTLNDVSVQSSSVDRLDIVNTTMEELKGTAKLTVITGSTLSSCKPGAWAFGRSDEFIAKNSVISAFSYLGVVEKGPADAGVDAGATMSAGVITWPNALGAPRWAVPGTWLSWRKTYNSYSSFQVTDVTQDVTNTYVATTWPSGFPTSAIFMQVHPAPKCTFISCTGCPEVVDLSGAPPGAPLFSYSRRTYTGAGELSAVPIWGLVDTITFNVTAAYAGATDPMKMERFENTTRPTHTTAGYNPFIDLRTTGSRVVTPAGVTGAKPNDSGLALPNAAAWLAEEMNVGLTAAVSGFSITVTIQTDQGLPDNRSFACNFS